MMNATMQNDANQLVETTNFTTLDLERLLLHNRFREGGFATPVLRSYGFIATNKRVSRRLAHAALTRTYGLTGYPYKNARFESVELKKKKAVIRVANAPQGLVVRDSLTGFEVASNDQVFYPATVAIRKNRIIVRSGQVAPIRAIRYCFGGWAPGTVHNRDGLPLLPFRTDN